jgi:TPR repeat protein
MFGYKKDETKAVKLLLRAVELGSTSAHYTMARYYSQGKMGVEQNMSKAIACLEVAAKSGETHAYFILGRIAHNSGKTDLALRYWRMSAKTGLKQAVDELIECHQKGLISKRSLLESMRARQDACEETRSEERDRYVAKERKKLSDGEDDYQYC